MKLNSKNIFNLKQAIPYLISLISLIILFLYLENGILYELENLWVHFRFPFKAIVYAGAFILSCLIILLTITSGNKPFVIAAVGFSSIFIFINQVYKLLNGNGITYEEVLILFQNVGFGLEDQILFTYFPYMFKALVFPATFIALSFFVRRNTRLHTLSIKYIILLVLLGIFVNYSIIAYSNGIRTSFPSPLKIPSLLLYTKTSPLYFGPKDSVSVYPMQTGEYDHIIWIVDESVRGDKLSINDSTLNTTPFLKSINGKNLINLGVASSGSVCSDYSHIIMMSGVQPQGLPDKKDFIRKTPTIFQFAQTAGYHTNLIYSPGYEDEPKGFLTKYDFEFINNRYNTKLLHPEMEHFLFDFKSLDELSRIVGSQSKSFTYFLKYGCHFHYETAYPPDKKHFTPTQEITDWKRENKEVLLNSYYNALRWTVDDFFKELMTILESQKDKKILIIYTSDHGQNLLEYPDIKLTHCTKTNAPSVMASVPMFILTPGNNIKNITTQTIHQETTPSHFQVFPTTLKLMGYDTSFIEENYGTTLFKSVKGNKNIFMSGDIFGRSTSYKNKFDVPSTFE